MKKVKRHFAEISPSDPRLFQVHVFRSKKEPEFNGALRLLAEFILLGQELKQDPLERKQTSRKEIESQSRTQKAL